jgi:hypothetical protein
MVLLQERTPLPLLLLFPHEANREFILVVFQSKEVLLGFTDWFVVRFIQL